MQKGIGLDNLYLTSAKKRFSLLYKKQTNAFRKRTDSLELPKQLEFCGKKQTWAAEPMDVSQPVHSWCPFPAPLRTYDDFFIARTADGSLGKDSCLNQDDCKLVPSTIIGKTFLETWQLESNFDLEESAKGGDSFDKESCKLVSGALLGDIFSEILHFELKSNSLVDSTADTS